MDSYTKLGDLVDDSFVVLKVRGFGYKMWDNEAKKMHFSNEPEKGYRKVYTIETNKGIMDLGAGQMGNLLEVVSQDGKSDIINWTFNVKSNGKKGKDIRYFLNPVWNKPAPEGDGKNLPLSKEQEADMQSYIPF
jgi:hypothetical protein